MSDLPADKRRLCLMLNEARRCGDRELALAIFAALAARSEFADARQRRRFA